MNLGTNHQITVKLGTTVTTNQCTGEASWEDVPAAPAVGARPDPIQGAADFVTTDATAVVIVPAAPKGYVRRVKTIFFYNADTATVTPNFMRHNISGNTDSTFFKGTRATLENLTYVDGIGMKAYSVAMAAQ
jgi:hypothetical protein